MNIFQDLKQMNQNQMYYPYINSTNIYSYMFLKSGKIDYKILHNKIYY